MFLRYGKKLYLLPCVAHIRQLFFKLGTWGKKDTQVLNIVRTYVLCLLVPNRTERELKYSKLVQSDAVRTFQVLRHLIQKSRKLSLASQVFVLRKLASIGLHIVLSIFFTERLICKFWERSEQNLGSNRRLRPPPLAIFSLGTPTEPISSAERYALKIINSCVSRKVFF